MYSTETNTVHKQLLLLKEPLKYKYLEHTVELYAQQQTKDLLQREEQLL